ncbi:MAG: carboxypeptidase-like regulatory domain-containing protein [Bacteroidetes bacterium]|nr:MAG: carboxypeptidase-like regulatory domain-containing protein [Bacteroidota bacterium]
MHVKIDRYQQAGKVFRKLTVLLLASGLSWSLTLTAQKQNFYFYGKVLDKETRQPLHSVNISFTGTTLGSATNSRGEFSFFIDTIPVYMTVSHLGYQTQRIWLDNSSPSITVLLKPEARLLQEVEIKATNEPIAFFKDSQYSVLDYAVDSNRVYMLIYRFRRAESELLCLSLFGDTTSCSGALPFRPQGLFHDCLGYIHVLSNDSSYQIFRDSSVLRLVYPSDIERFRKTLSDCVASAGDLLFFRKVSRNQLGVEFYTINRKTSQRQHLTRADDEKKMKMLRRNPDDNALLMMGDIPDSREAFQQYSWIKNVLYKPNTSSLHKLEEMICVFNTADYTLELYTLNGDFAAKLKMQVQETNDGRWTTEIYVDEIDHKIYTSFLKNGTFTLYRIDLNNGDLKRIVTASHMYPQKVKVHHNFLFYVYDVPGTGDNKHMFRQKL